MLKELRQNAKLTQKELAKQFGYTSPQFISNIERGVSHLPPKQFKKMAKILKTSAKLFVDHHVKLTEKRLYKKLGIKK